MTEHSIEILLVEDNPNDEMLALHAFKKLNIANKIHVVRDGAEALEYVFCTGAYAQRHFENPRVILLDKKLPLVDGMDVLRAIRLKKIRTPVIVLTAADDVDTKVRALSAGADVYITKPFHKAELVARINAVVRRSRGHSESIIRTGNIALNLDTRTTEVAGVKLSGVRAQGPAEKAGRGIGSLDQGHEWDCYGRQGEGHQD